MMTSLFNVTDVWGQSSADSTRMYQLQISKDLPLDQVLREQDPVFYAASRKLDSLKNVALNVSILTKESIKQSGANNLAEVLQLLPEFLVEQKGNGLYNIKYRGVNSSFNNVAHHQVSENLLLLFNAIPYNDALTGEIWWEAIPVSVEDIERIEVIRSPHGSWYGYGGAIGVINIITQKSKNILGTQLKANVQVGEFRSYGYHGTLNIGINEKFSIKVGGHYQSRQRFQETYYVNSVDRYVRGDSLLFYQPEASQTHVYTDLALQSSAFHLSTAYQWDSEKSISMDLGNYHSLSQSTFIPSEEIIISSREVNNRWINVHLSTPSWNTHIFHQSGDKDYATGYLGWQYQTARTGARLEYHTSLGRYSLLVGTELIKDQYSPDNSINNRLEFQNGLTPLDSWDQLLASLYLQQTAVFAKNRLYLTSSQRIYQNLQNLEYPLGYHLAAKWFLKKNTALQVSASQVVQTTQQLYHDTVAIVVHQAVQARSYEFGIEQHWTNRGLLKASAFYQEIESLSDQYPQNIPPLGSSLEGIFQMNRWSIRGSLTRLLESEQQEALYPLWIGSVSGNFTALFERLNLNAGLYYYSGYNALQQVDYMIPAQWLVHTKCAYKVWNEYSVYANVWNLLNKQNVTVPYADQNSRLITVGLNMVF